MQARLFRRSIIPSTRNFSQWIYPDLHINAVSGAGAYGGQIVRATTICSVVAKPNTKKVSYLSNSTVICGFAGAAADGITLIDLLEKKLEEYNGKLLRASVELSKLWRTDKMLRNLNALLIAADSEISLTLSGSGEVIESHSPVIAVGSGGNFAEAAGRALYREQLSADEICLRAMQVASDMCIYTNSNFRLVELENKAVEKEVLEAPFSLTP